MSLTIGSLFSGIGGLELGLEWAGLGPVAWQVEQDEFCTSILAKHWPDAIRHRDVREVGRHNLGPVDVICGGFPCQDISTAGRGAGLAGARSGLWSEYARIVRELRPRYVVVENVSALLRRGIDRVLGDLAACGYDAQWRCIRASDFGLPHRRERIFLVANSRELLVVKNKNHQPEQLEQKERRDSGGCAPVLGHGSQRHESVMGRVPHGLPGRMDNAGPSGRNEPQCDWEPPRTFVGATGRYKRLKAVGNAVVPACAYAAGRVVMALEDAA